MLKIVIKFISPPIFIYILRSIRDNFNYFLSDKIQNWGINLYNQECVIIGNGPSLINDLDTHDKLFLNKVKVCVNFFPLSDLFDNMKPSFLILADPIFHKNLNDFDNSEKDIFNKSRINNLIEKLKTVEWQLGIIIPKLAKNKYFELSIKQNLNLKVHFINSDNCSYLKKKQKFKYFQSNIYAPPFYNVIVAALFFSINVGIKKIYLCGFDHNFIHFIHVDQNNKVFRAPDVITSKKSTIFRPDINIGDIYKELLNTYKSYEILKQYADYSECKIYNCTKGSMIDIFERY